MSNRNIFIEALEAKSMAVLNLLAVGNAQPVVVNRPLIASAVLKSAYSAEYVISRELYDEDSIFGECLIWVNPHFEFPSWEGRNVAEYLNYYGSSAPDSANALQYQTKKYNSQGLHVENVTLAQLSSAKPGAENQWFFDDGTVLVFFSKSADLVNAEVVDADFSSSPDATPKWTVAGRYHAEWWRIHDEEENTIATVCHKTHADLIGAAPAMYAALTYLKPIITNPSGRVMGDFAAALALIEQVMAQATGGA